MNDDTQEEQARKLAGQSEIGQARSSLIRSACCAAASEG